MRPNIIPDSVSMHGTLRTFDPDIRNDIIERMRRTAHSVAAPSGAQAVLTMSRFPSPVVFND